MNAEIKASVSEKKVQEVKELSNLLGSKKTILIASIKNLPASQFQEISKKLRGKAIIKVPKKNLIFRAIDESGKEYLKEFKEKIVDNSVILFSDIDSFELASELLDSKRPAKAKAGQESPEDISVPEGPTDLVSGPVISDFGALGIQIQIDKGKITIKKSKVIAKEGKKISGSAASMMDKLDIRPFSIGFVPLAAADNEAKIIYLEIKIDKEATLKELKTSFSRALVFAVEINHPTEETISFMISKAAMNEKALSNLLEKETENVEEELSEEKEEGSKKILEESKSEEDDQTLEENSKEEN
ncbi:MAG: 50S ribosomal protein L10 [Candidatus Pacearchaeota archaeon]